MICLTLALNVIHLEAARRLRDGLLTCGPGLEVLLLDHQRLTLTSADRRRWPLRLPLGPRSYRLLGALALFGLVREVRLPHIKVPGMDWNLVVNQASRIVLLDDGLDQFRELPRAVDPQTFAAGIDYWLFSDAPTWRAPWCERFHCRELGPLFPAPSLLEFSGNNGSCNLCPDMQGTLIIDSPGIERIHEKASSLLHPWWLIPHPVVAKRSWSMPLGDTDNCLKQNPADLIPYWKGTIVVGESLMLLAALRLRSPSTRLIISLPTSVDCHLYSCVGEEASQSFVYLAGPHI